MSGWSVMLRGIRYRAGRSLVVLLLAAFATLAAVLAPAYGRAAQQSVLTDALSAAPASAAALTISSEGTAEGSAAAHQPVGESQAVADKALRGMPELSAVLGKPVTAVETEAQLDGPKEDFAARLAWRMGVCAQIRVVEGDCAIDADEAMLSMRSATLAGVKAGDTVTLRSPRGTEKPKRLKIVGLYTPLDTAAPYWGKSVYFAQSTQPAEGKVRLDTILTGAEDDVRLSDGTTVAIKLTYPVRADTVKLDAVPLLRNQLGALGLALNSAELQLETALLSIVDDAARDQEVLSRTIPIIAVPLVILAWIVLFLLVATLIEDRGPELALARLRGFPNGRTVRFGLGETLLLILLGAPLGLAGGIGAVELASRYLLASGTHVELRWPIFAAAAGGLVLATFAAWLAARSTMRRGVLTLLRRVPARAGWRAGVFEGAIVALAAASIFVAVQDRSAPLALLAPVALAVVSGVLAGRLLSLWAKLRLSIARKRGKVSTMLATAQLARRAGATRTVAVLTAAVALLMFAAMAWDVASGARSKYAEEALGAPTVHQVLASHPQALLAAVNAADPSGNSMAVVRSDEQFGANRVELLGVQSDRMSKVVQWRDHDAAALTALAQQLRTGGREPAVVRKKVGMEVGASALGPVPMRIGVTLAAPGEPPAVLWLGLLRAGVHQYEAAAPLCGAGCRIVGVALGRTGSADGSLKATLTLRSVEADDAAVKLGDGVWRPDTERTPRATIGVTTGDPIRVTVDSPEQGDVQVSYLDTPENLPAVLAGAAPVGAGDGGKDSFVFPGFADVQQGFAVVDKASLLPRAGSHGLLFDLDLAERAASASVGLADSSELRYEVWAGPDAPADLVKRLGDQGVALLHTQTMAKELEQLGRRAPALGLRLYLLAGIAAAVLALGVVLLTLRLGAAQRMTELAALRITGVRPKTLRRAMRRERSALLTLPLLVGIGAGIGAAALMVPGVALVRTGVIGQSLTIPIWTDVLPIAVVSAVLVVVLLVLLAGRSVRRARPELAGGER